MEVTGETLLRVGKGELEGLLVSMTPGQGWTQNSGQSLSSLVRFFFFLFVVTERNQKQRYCDGCFPVPGAALCVWKMTLYAMYLASK